MLQHVSTVAALELEKLGPERDALSRAGAELLGELLAGRTEVSAAQARLRAAGLAGPTGAGHWSYLPAAHGSLHQELYAPRFLICCRPESGDRLPLALML